MSYVTYIRIEGRRSYLGRLLDNWSSNGAIAMIQRARGSFR